MLVGSFSPLVKVFQSQWHNEAMDNIDILFDDTVKGWNIHIPKPSGAYEIKFATPREEHNKAILHWLTGGITGLQSPSTDEYGVVQIQISAEETGELFARLNDILNVDDDTKEFKKLIKSQREGIKTAMQLAKEASEKRVWAAINRVYTNIKNQYKTNKESNFGLYDPSPTEYLCAELVSRSLSDQNKRESQMAKRMSAIMSEHENINAKRV